MGQLQWRNDITGSSLVNEEKIPQKLYRRCPHCGLIDKHYSSSGMNEVHHQIWAVGAVNRYECGRCRKSFDTFEIVPPEGVSVTDMYERINHLLRENR